MEPARRADVGRRADPGRRGDVGRRAATRRPQLQPRAAIGLVITVIAIVIAVAVRSWASAALVTIPGDPAAASPSIPADAAPVTAESGSPSAESASPSAESGSPSAAPDSDASGGALSSEQNVGGVAGGEVVVHVTGAVNVPGVFTLPVGSRIDDAILLAGGFAPDANEGGLNRALVLQDGQQVRVPRIGEELPPSAEVGPGGGSGASGGSSGSGGGNASGSGSGGKVNLNRASSQELETLPGIGPSLAGAIIRWREANGDFTSVSKLDDVPGIGPVLMDRLADLVTV